MIRIKDYILNEDDISYIVGNTDDDTELKIQWKGDTSTYIKASFEDIECNYGTNGNNKLKEEYLTLEKDYGTCEIENGKLRTKIKELEEENKKLKDPSNYYQYASKLVKTNCESLQQRIDKAIEYIGNGNLEIPRKTRKKFIKILKGEENERNTKTL